MKKRIFLVMAVGAAVAMTMPAAIAANPQQPRGTLDIDVAHVTTLEQLKQTLESHGYTNVKLAPNKPNEEDPRPDLEDNGPGKKSTFNAGRTPVHAGWEGTAMKDGKTVNVVIDTKGHMTTH